VESIRNVVINYDMVTLHDVVLGGQPASIMKPMPDKIRELRDQVFTAGGAVSPLAGQGQLTPEQLSSLMQQDAARVRVVNGSLTGGLENTTAQYLQSLGFQVTELGPAPNGTEIIVYAPKLYTLKYLQVVFGIADSARISIQPNPASTVDIEVRLGQDWANSNPMP
jgi:hypothetical protein